MVRAMLRVVALLVFALSLAAAEAAGSGFGRQQRQPRLGRRDPAACAGGASEPARRTTTPL